VVAVVSAFVMAVSWLQPLADLATQLRSKSMPACWHSKYCQLTPNSAPGVAPGADWDAGNQRGVWHAVVGVT
jgi:hypothetical protein